MADDPPSSTWREIVGKASSWTLKAAKTAGSEGARLAKAAAEHAREQHERRRAEAAERQRAEEAANAEWQRKKEEAEAQAKALRLKHQELLNRLKIRWPEDRFARTTQAARYRMEAELPGMKDAPSLREDLWDWWDMMLEQYPYPPENEDERKFGEDKFWQRYVDMFSKNSHDGFVSLEQKQNIMDFAWAYEKWVLREYYAATGIIKESFYGFKFNKYASWERTIYVKVKNFGDLPLEVQSSLGLFMAVSDVRRGVIDKYNKRSEEYWEREQNNIESDVRNYFSSLDSHKEKYLDWFFFNVERAFKARYEAPKQTASVHGEARAASESEARSAAQGQGARRSPVHDQEF